MRGAAAVAIRCLTEGFDVLRHEDRKKGVK